MRIVGCLGFGARIKNAPTESGPNLLRRERVERSISRYVGSALLIGQADGIDVADQPRREESPRELPADRRRIRLNGSGDLLTDC